MTKPISISSCNFCNPETWKVGKPSAGTYICKNCKNVVKNVLTKKKEKKNG